MRRLTLNRGYALVDNDDYKHLSQWKWHLSSKGYAVRNEYLGKSDGKYRSRTVMMHRVILDAPSGMDVDHKNGNRLDNRKENIRICTRSQNLANIAAIFRRKHQLPRGISYNPSPRSKQPYMARVSHQGKSHFLGNFYTLDEAVEAYTAKRKELYGEFAP